MRKFTGQARTRGLGRWKRCLNIRQETLQVPIHQFQRTWFPGLGEKHTGTDICFVDRHGRRRSCKSQSFCLCNGTLGTASKFATLTQITVMRNHHRGTNKAVLFLGCIAEAMHPSEIAIWWTWFWDAIPDARFFQNWQDFVLFLTSWKAQRIVKQNFWVWAKT